MDGFFCINELYCENKKSMSWIKFHTCNYFYGWNLIVNEIMFMVLIDQTHVLIHMGEMIYMDKFMPIYLPNKWKSQDDEIAFMYEDCHHPHI